MLLTNVLVIIGTVGAVYTWPRFETGLVLFVELAIFALMFSIFWKQRVRVGKLVDELQTLIEKRRKTTFQKMAPPELAKHLLAELEAGPFAPAAVAKFSERVKNQEWHDLKVEWPALSNQLFAERNQPESVKDAALVLAYVSLGIDRLP